MFVLEKRLKLRKKTRTMFEWEEDTKQWFAPEKLKLRKKTISTHSLTSSHFANDVYAILGFNMLLLVVEGIVIGFYLVLLVRVVAFLLYPRAMTSQGAWRKLRQLLVGGCAILLLIGTIEGLFKRLFVIVLRSDCLNWCSYGTYRHFNS